MKNMSMKNARTLAEYGILARNNQADWAFLAARSREEKGDLLGAEQARFRGFRSLVKAFNFAEKEA